MLHSIPLTPAPAPKRTRPLPPLPPLITTSPYIPIAKKQLPPVLPPTSTKHLPPNPPPYYEPANPYRNYYYYSTTSTPTTSPFPRFSPPLFSNRLRQLAGPLRVRVRRPGEKEQACVVNTGTGGVLHWFLFTLAVLVGLGVAAVMVCIVLVGWGVL